MCFLSSCWLAPGAFHFAFLLPLGLIMVTNLVLFILIIRGITCNRGSGLRTNQTKLKLVWLQVQAAMCCFVVMGKLVLLYTHSSCLFGFKNCLRSLKLWRIQHLNVCSQVWLGCSPSSPSMELRSWCSSSSASSTHSKVSSSSSSSAFTTNSFESPAQNYVVVVARIMFVCPRNSRSWPFRGRCLRDSWTNLRRISCTKWNEWRMTRHGAAAARKLRITRQAHSKRSWRMIQGHRPSSKIWNHWKQNLKSNGVQVWSVRDTLEAWFMSSSPVIKPW